MKYEELNAQERKAYRAGYHAGKDDTLAMLAAAAHLMLDHPDVDFCSPEGLESLLNAAEHALQARNPRMRLTRPAC